MFNLINDILLNYIKDEYSGIQEKSTCTQCGGRLIIIVYIINLVQHLEKILVTKTAKYTVRFVVDVSRGTL